jgi:hypothetical protein
MSALPASDPILSCAEAREFEAARFGGDEALEWPAMQRAGRALAAAVPGESGAPELAVAVQAVARAESPQ